MIIAVMLIIKNFVLHPGKKAGAGNADVFDNSYIDVKSYYLQEFGTMPSLSFVGNLHVRKAFDYVNEGNAGKVLDVYQRTYYNWQLKKQESIKTVFKLENRLLIEIGHDYAEIFFPRDRETFVDKLVAVLVEQKAPEKEEAFEMNIITVNNNSLELKQLQIKPTQLDLSLYYNDDFIAVDQLIRRRLEQDNDKGIILLHGLPGTGKTTYLRHLIGGMSKKVLFVSPAVAADLMNPEFIDLLIDNPNAVLVIEDAENIIMDRKLSNNAGVSNLLNISDGLLSDCLNVQIICTFNNALSMVDSALMRKGRLIAKYEFSKLDTGKAQTLSDHLGFTIKIERPMTIAEITNPGDIEVSNPSQEVIGFRRGALMN
jgi:hypothetical protein